MKKLTLTILCVLTFAAGTVAMGTDILCYRDEDTGQIFCFDCNPQGCTPIP